MRFRREHLFRGTCTALLAMVALVGCRSSGTSYQVKWAKRGEAVAKSDASEKGAQKSPPIQQTSASRIESDADIEIDEDDGIERKTRWGGLFGRHEKPKRVQLPRTDLIEDDEPVAKDPSFGQF